MDLHDTSRLPKGNHRRSCRPRVISLVRSSPPLCRCLVIVEQRHQSAGSGWYANRSAATSKPEPDWLTTSVSGLVSSIRRTSFILHCMRMAWPTAKTRSRNNNTDERSAARPPPPRPRPPPGRTAAPGSEQKTPERAREPAVFFIPRHGSASDRSMPLRIRSPGTENAARSTAANACGVAPAASRRRQRR